MHIPFPMKKFPMSAAPMSWQTKRAYLRLCPEKKRIHAFKDKRISINCENYCQAQQIDRLRVL